MSTNRSLSTSPSATWPTMSTGWRPPASRCRPSMTPAGRIPSRWCGWRPAPAAAVLATSDAVLPVSSETSCSNCHSSPLDFPGVRTRAPTQQLADAGLPVARQGCGSLHGRAQYLRQSAWNTPRISISCACTISSTATAMWSRLMMPTVTWYTSPMPATRRRGYTAPLTACSTGGGAATARGLPELPLHPGAGPRPGGPDGRSAGQ